MMVAAQFKVDPTEFTGRRVLVTGGTKGAGEAIMRRFRASGARTVTSARSEPASDLGEDLFIRADLATVQGVEAVAEVVMSGFGGVDILVHCLGGSSTPTTREPAPRCAGRLDPLKHDLPNLRTSPAARPVAVPVLGRRSGIVAHAVRSTVIPT